MMIITHTPSVMLVADKGKILRAKNDVYVPEYIDENGNRIDEHIPYRTSVVFLSSIITEEEARNLYIEEDE